MGIFSRKNKKDESASETTAATSDAAPEVRPGTSNLVVNRLVQDALGPWSSTKNAQTMYGVLRQCATG